LRNGGDETSAFLIDSSEQAIREAFRTIGQEVAAIARRYKVNGIPHPKHPNDKRFNGTGVRFGLVRLWPVKELDPGLIFRQADSHLKSFLRAELDDPLPGLNQA
jgi:hypothetical protein